MSSSFKPAPRVAGIWILIVLLAALRAYLPTHYDPNITAFNKTEAMRVGYFVHTGAGWVNPFPPFPTGPTAHIAPGFPLILAGTYAILGDGALGAYAVKMLEATVLVLQVALIPLLARSLGAGFNTGLLAALIAVLGMRRTLIWEANYVALMLVVATLLACRYLAALRDGRSPLRIAWILGGLWGVLLLTGPNAGPIWLCWLVAGAWLSWRSGYRYAWVPALLVPLVMVTPWIWRNYTVFHRFIPIRDNLGLEMAVAHNPCAKVSYLESKDSHCFQHPYLDKAEAQKMAAMGEADYYDLRMREALEWIRHNPARAVELWSKRALNFWLPAMNGDGSGLTGANSRFSLWVLNLMTLCSIPGLFLLFRDSRVGAILCGIFLLVYPLVYYIVQYIERYRYPILWVTFLLAAVTIRAAAVRAFRSLGWFGNVSWAERQSTAA
jgi:hypothetical protein